MPQLKIRLLFRSYPLLALDQTFCFFLEVLVQNASLYYSIDTFLLFKKFSTRKLKFSRDFRFEIFKGDKLYS